MAPSLRVAGRRVGIVGLGRIGQAIARRCTALGLPVAYSGPQPKADCPYPFHADVGDLAAVVDILILSCPGGAATRHLVNAAVLARLGAEGTLVNVSRGTVVDEEALIAALSAGTIAGAGLDVYASEPAIDPRFHALDNVVLQPHSASITREARAAMVARITGDIAAFLAGQPFFDAAAR
jgi:lactate dehydrogenase-like 2-hydroxyacid dehydrogenase